MQIVGSRFKRLVSSLNSKYAAIANNLTPEQQQEIVRLHNFTAALHKIAENECNGHPREVTEVRDGKMYRYNVEDEAWTYRDRVMKAALEVKVMTICRKNGWEVEFQGDPRGAVVKLKIGGYDMTDILYA